VLTARRVFGDAIERDGVTVIPAARLRGRAGGKRAEGRGGGARRAGLKLSARPAGVVVIRDGNVSWHPAIDVNRIVAGGQVVALTIAALVYLARRERRAGRR
jgi:uncharacterized spore protein YtfJ